MRAEGSEVSSGSCSSRQVIQSDLDLVSVATVGWGLAPPAPAQCLAMALILLPMPRAARVGCADKLPQDFTATDTCLKSHSCQQHDWREGGHRLSQALRLGGVCRGYSFLVCPLSTGRPIHAVWGMCHRHATWPRPNHWLLCCKASHSGPTDRMRDMTCESCKGWCLRISLPEKLGPVPDCWK